jgi:hypothetical protein
VPHPAVGGAPYSLTMRVSIYSSLTEVEFSNGGQAVEKTHVMCRHLFLMWIRCEHQVFTHLWLVGFRATRTAAATQGPAQAQRLALLC